MDLSLDEIIKKNKKPKTGLKPGGMKKKVINSGKISKQFRRPPATNVKRPISDARAKIINKNRTKIQDARDIIATNSRKSIKDARELLSTKKKKTPNAAAVGGGLRKKPAIPSVRALRALTASLRADELIEKELKAGPPLSAFRRTVRNDHFVSMLPPSMPKPPQFSMGKVVRNSSPDPFDCYVVNQREHIPLAPVRNENPRFHQPRRLMNAHMDAFSPSKFSSKLARYDDHDDRMDTDHFSSNENVRNRLFSHEPRDRNESAGIFAKLPVRASSPPALRRGHRLIISNLDESVTEADVIELFMEVGKLKSAKLYRPGTAEVVYENLGDAERAVDTYHNRQLDGQPMKCHLCTKQQ